MKPSGAGFPTGDGIITQNYGRMDFKTYLGVTDGEGGFNAWYTHRVEAVTQNFTAPKYLTDIFGPIETTIDDNFTYRGTLDLKIWKASFKTEDVNKNLYYPAEFTRTISLQNEWMRTGYAIDTMMYKTAREWSALTQNYEASMIKNKKTFQINKTILMIYTTCLATGNFKVIDGLTSTNVADPEKAKGAYRDARNAIIGFGEKWTTQNHGIPENYQILFAPYAFQGALDSAGATNVNAAPQAFEAYVRGQIVKWYGFDIREYAWLGRNRFFNVDVSNEQRLQSNATGYEFDFKNISALLWSQNTVIRKQKPEFFTLGENGNFSGFYYQAFVGGTNVVDLARSLNFTLDVFVEPFKEAWNMVVFNKAPSVDDCLNARKYISSTYPTLYQGINPENGYMVGDADGTNTKNAIAQWIEAASVYVFDGDGDTFLPQDTNIYGFKEKLVNTNGITKQAATKAKGK